jgi:hypothetical protein
MNILILTEQTIYFIITSHEDASVRFWTEEVCIENHPKI